MQDREIAECDLLKPRLPTWIPPYNFNHDGCGVRPLEDSLSHGALVLLAVFPAEDYGGLLRMGVAPEPQLEARWSQRIIRRI